MKIFKFSTHRNRNTYCPSYYAHPFCLLYYYNFILIAVCGSCAHHSIFSHHSALPQCCFK